MYNFDKECLYSCDGCRVFQSIATCKVNVWVVGVMTKHVMLVGLATECFASCYLYFMCVCFFYLFV